MSNFWTKSSRFLKDRRSIVLFLFQFLTLSPFRPYSFYFRPSYFTLSLLRSIKIRFQLILFSPLCFLYFYIQYFLLTFYSNYSFHILFTTFHENCTNFFPRNFSFFSSVSLSTFFHSPPPSESLLSLSLSSRVSDSINTPLACTQLSIRPTQLSDAISIIIRATAYRFLGNYTPLTKNKRWRPRQQHEKSFMRMRYPFPRLPLPPSLFIKISRDHDSRFKTIKRIDSKRRYLLLIVPSIFFLGPAFFEESLAISRKLLARLAPFSFIFIIKASKIRTII